MWGVRSVEGMERVGSVRGVDGMGGVNRMWRQRDDRLEIL